MLLAGSKTFTSLIHEVHREMFNTCSIFSLSVLVLRFYMPHSPGCLLVTQTLPLNYLVFQCPIVDHVTQSGFCKCQYTQLHVFVILFYLGQFHLQIILL